MNRDKLKLRKQNGYLCQNSSQRLPILEDLQSFLEKKFSEQKFVYQKHENMRNTFNSFGIAAAPEIKNAKMFPKGIEVSNCWFRKSNILRGNRDKNYQWSQTNKHFSRKIM